MVKNHITIIRTNGELTIVTSDKRLQSKKINRDII